MAGLICDDHPSIITKLLCDRGLVVVAVVDKVTNNHICLQTAEKKIHKVTDNKQVDSNAHFKNKVLRT